LVYATKWLGKIFEVHIHCNEETVANVVYTLKGWNGKLVKPSHGGVDI